MVKTKRLSDYRSGIVIPDDYYVTGFVDATNYSFPVSALYTYMWEGSATNLESLYTTVRQTSSVFSTVQANSATNWSYQGTDIKSLTGGWQSVYTTVNQNSANAFSGNFNVVNTNNINTPNIQFLYDGDPYGTIFIEEDYLTLEAVNNLYLQSTDGQVSVRENLSVENNVKSESIWLSGNFSESPLQIFSETPTSHAIETTNDLTINAGTLMLKGFPTSNPGPGIMWYDAGTASFKMGT